MRRFALVLVLCLAFPASAFANDCCQAHDYPGCSDGGIESCVCAQDDYCCATEWDSYCVEEVADFGCGNCGPSGPVCGNGQCESGESCTSCPNDCGPCQGSGDCCQPQDGPGCGNATVQNCVCSKDSFCCENQWDQICVNEVGEFGCGSCSEGPGCGNGQCDADENCQICPEDCGFCGGDGDCCQANGTPGCSDPAIQSCVCADDAFCCDTEWDNICAEEVENFECGDCGGGGAECADGQCDGGENCETCPEDCGPCEGGGACCEAHDGPGCDDPTVQACVCAEDSFCCEYSWDGICVGEVEELGCGSCSGGGCGDGQCLDPEDCIICPEDCGECQGASCCQPHETPGCDDPAVQACVCAEDAYCCEQMWDDICVDEVTSLGCGNCGGDGPQCGNGECEGGENCGVCPQDCGECDGQGDCCAPHETPGCNDPGIQKCVCDLDAFCCAEMWDEICVEEVEAENCGQCGECVPNCDGLQCGGDGCGGTCGQCPPDKSCQDGHCIADGCAPDCAGKQCGDDGCGGTCGGCPPGETCHSGTCKGGGCEPACQGKQCGDDGCGGSCGNCAPGYFCENGHCGKECKPDCAGKQCGPDGCGGSCGSCPPQHFCTANGHCDQQCQPDCAGKQCGDDGCGGTCGTCPPGKSCNNGHCSYDCVPDCAGKQCGDDGCGGSCGTCDFGDNCNLQGHCVSNCMPQCIGKECGTDGCGGDCGSCAFDMACNGQGLCVPLEEECHPNCTGKECGDDGCGGSCGICGFNETCSLNLCVACTPQCTGKQCGDDGCGGVCGACANGTVCSEKIGSCVSPDDPSLLEDDAYGEEDGAGSSGCPSGYRLQYGKCVYDETLDEDNVPDSGCSSGGRGSGAGLLLLLLALAGLAGLPRRRGVELDWCLFSLTMHGSSDRQFAPLESLCAHHRAVDNSGSVCDSDDDRVD